MMATVRFEPRKREALGVDLGTGEEEGERLREDGMARSGGMQPVVVQLRERVAMEGRV